jgi:hypothetical protein
MVDGDVEITPSGAGKPGTYLVIQAELAVPFERELHRRPQDSVALFVGDPAARDDADDVVRQLLDQLEHRVIPRACALPVVATSDRGGIDRGRCRSV